MKFLESGGHSTDIVENGALAVEAVKNNYYDVHCICTPSRLIGRTYCSSSIACIDGFIYAFMRRS